MPRRGRPPKNKPLNTVDDNGRNSLNSSHHSSSSLSSSHEDEDHISSGNNNNNNIGGNNNNNNNNNKKGDSNFDIKLLLPSVDLIPKIIENGYISKLSSMSTIPYNDNGDSDDENHNNNNNNNNNDDKIMIDKEDLKHACEDVLKFKKYVRDSKILINKQIEKLEKFEDRFQNNNGENNSIPLKAIVQRNKYKPNIRKQPISSFNNLSLSPTHSSTSTTNTFNNNNNNNHQQIDIDFKDDLSSNSSSNNNNNNNNNNHNSNILDAPKSSEFESGSERSFTANNYNKSSKHPNFIEEHLNNNNNNNNIANESNDNMIVVNDNITSSATTNTDNNNNNNNNNNSNSKVGGKGGKKNRSSSRYDNSKLRVNESDEDIEILELDEHVNNNNKNNNNNGGGGNKTTSSNNNNNNNNSNTFDSDLYQREDPDDSLASQSESESVHSNKSSVNNNKSNNNTSKNRKGAPKNNKRKANVSANEDKKRKKQEEEARTQYVGPAVFWASMDNYLRPITDTDIEFVTPKTDEQESKYFEVPPLGTHYTEIWLQEDQDRYHSLINSMGGGGSGKHRSNARSTAGNRANHHHHHQNHNNNDQDSSSNGGGQDLFGNPLQSLFSDLKDTDNHPLSISTDEIFLGDLSMRLLSTLIDENMILSAPINNANNGSNNQSTSNSTSQPMIKLNQPLTTIYTPNSQLTLEQRIQQELRGIGLYDDCRLPTSVNELLPTKEKERDREDDEISEELRMLQNQLRLQLHSNNQLKLKALKECKTVLSNQELLRKRKNHQTNSEKNYIKLMKRDKKKKKLKNTSLLSH